MLSRFLFGIVHVSCDQALGCCCGVFFGVPCGVPCGVFFGVPCGVCPVVCPVVCSRKFADTGYHTSTRTVLTLTWFRLINTWYVPPRVIYSRYSTVVGFYTGTTVYQARPGQEGVLPGDFW